MSVDIFSQHLDPNPANFVPLSPLSLLERSATVYPDRTAVIHGSDRYSYRQFRERCVRLASALSQRGIGMGDTVAIMAPNVPAMLEAHFGVAMCGAVLNALNIRLDAATVAFILQHGEAKVLITDREFSTVVKPALEDLEHKPLVIDIDDPLHPEGELLGELDYEAFIANGDPDYAYPPVDDEWRAISLNYTSGTTGNPKGVVYHHRGAYLNALGNALAMNLSEHTVYLWTLPMFHCNGWSHTWTITAVGGTHVCLRRVDPALIFPLIQEHQVNYLCGAPVVLNLLVHAPDEVKQRFAHGVRVATGGAAPPSRVIAEMESLGFHVIHLYGLTETYGPATLCVEQPGWETLPLEERAAQVARQGVTYHTQDQLMIADLDGGAELPWDGQSLGELLLRGNTVMKGYLKNPTATAEALRDGWFHTGDLGVRHPDGYVEIKDRAKDVIISGGENISSLEVEELLYKHPLVMEAAVVARPDPRWGETPCAFVTLKPGSELDEDSLRHWCRERIAHFKVPRSVVFGPLPKTATGKIQKFVLRDQARELPSREDPINSP